MDTVDYNRLAVEIKKFIQKNTFPLLNHLKNADDYLKLYENTDARIMWNDQQYLCVASAYINKNEYEMDVFKQKLGEDREHLPLLTLDEFFDGNPEEDSIAPNQWGYGRPALVEIRDMLQRIESMPNVVWIRVALHDDTEIREENGTEVLDLAGDSIVICTEMKLEELEKTVNCEWLCSGGVIESNPNLYYSCIPPIPDNYNCWEIVWD